MRPFQKYAFLRGGGAGGSGGGGGGPILVTEDPYYLNTHFQIDATGQSNGTGYAADESRHAHALTYNNGAAIASEYFEFDGTNDFITAPANVLWVFGSRFTIELKNVVFDDNSSTQVLLSYNNNSGSIYWQIALSGGTLEFERNVSGTVLDTGWTPTTGVAYDLTFAWDGANIRFYLDGVYHSKTALTGVFGNSGAVLGIGCERADATPRFFFNGRMKAIRVTRGYDRAQASETSYVRHALPLCTTQSATTDPNWDDVLLLVSGGADGATIRDESPYDWPLAKAGNVAVNASVQPLSGVNSIAFDGSGDYLSVPDNPLIEIGGGNVTVELFARHSVITTVQTYLGKWNTSSNRSWSLQLRGSTAPKTLSFAISSNGSSASLLTQDWAPSADTFYHIAYTRSGDTHRHFAGGTQLGSDVSNTIAPFNSNATLFIGRLPVDEMNGYMSEIRITKGTARYTSNFTAPSAAFPRG